jgi:2'-5' RNA ligase
MGNADTAPTGLATDNGGPLRVFVGIRVAPEIAGKLVRIAQGLKRPEVRPVATADIHITLVPPWDETAMPEAVEKLRGVAGRFAAFSPVFRHVGFGPRPRRPRLLWAECAANDEVVALRRASGAWARKGRPSSRP